MKLNIQISWLFFFIMTTALVAFIRIAPAEEKEPLTFITVRKERVETPEEKITFRVTSGQRQLFFDDEGIEDSKNLERIMHQPEKKGSVITTDLPWEGIIQTWSTPEWVAEDKCFKLWYFLTTTSGESGIAYAESRDGFSWSKPILRLVELNGSLDNNLVTKDTIYNIIYDPDDTDPSRRYKALRLNVISEPHISADGITWKRSPRIIPQRHGNYYLSFVLNMEYHPESHDPSRRYTSIGYLMNREPMVSADGFHWRSLNVPGIATADEGILTYDRDTRTYIATVKQGELGIYGRSVTLSTSKDFEHWSEPELIFHADELDWKLAKDNIRERLSNPEMMKNVYIDSNEFRSDVYNMRIFNYEGIYIGLPAFFHHTGLVPDKTNWDGFHIVQLASSRDLKNWRRHGNRKPFLYPSKSASGAVDLTYIGGFSCPVIFGNELWFYYTGLKYRSTPEGETNKGAVCLAVLRRDGFISMDAGNKEGVLTTKTFFLTGSKLYVNVDAEKGWIQVDMLDIDGNTIASSGRISGDIPRNEINWEKGNLKSIQQKGVALRFKLKNASFYSYWLE
ncbi:hypothetical protein ACFL1R_11980 [Candidatus Latescibacterota bacterium]